MKRRILALLLTAAALWIAVSCATGDVSTPSETTLEEQGPVGRVKNVVAEPYDGGVMMTWDAVPGADGYCIYRLAEDGYRAYKFTDVPYKGFIGLTNGTEYIFHVAAYVVIDGVEYYGECSEDVSVVPVNNVLKISDTFIVIRSGETYQLSCLLYDKPQKAVWSSSDQAVATVDSAGKVHAVGAGTATVTAKSDGEKFYCTVCVDRKAPAPKVDTSARFAKGDDGVYRQNEMGEEGSARLLFTGDLMAVFKQMAAAKQDDGSYDFSASFARVSPYLHDADLLVGNLETTISESFPYSLDLAKYNGVSNCNTVSSYLDALKTAGFDLLMTANNHYCDSGPTGLLETLGHLDEYNFMHIGTYRDKNEPRVIVAEINGIRVGFLDYNQRNTNGKEEMFTEKQQKEMLGKWYRSKVPNDIETARGLGAEFIVVCIHYGVQNQVTVTETQESINKYLADCGADLIVGSHPHLLQKFTYVTASDGRPVPVACSMGNFCSSMLELDLNTENYILNVTLKRQGGEIVIGNIDYTPCRILASTPEGQYVITPTSETEGLNAEQTALLRASEESIARTLGDEIKRYRPENG